MDAETNSSLKSAVKYSAIGLGGIFLGFLFSKRGLMILATMIVVLSVLGTLDGWSEWHQDHSDRDQAYNIESYGPKQQHSDNSFRDKKLELDHEYRMHGINTDLDKAMIEAGSIRKR